MTLEVQICTYGASGLARVAQMQLPRVDGVIYLVSLQNPHDEYIPVPGNLLRDDIRIITHATSGLSVNRNIALSNSSAEIVLIADDDLNYTSDGLLDVKRVFEQNESLDFATFRHSGGDNNSYPDYEFDMAGQHPKGYYVTSFEIAIRRAALPDNIRFSSNMGVGAPLFGACEENLLVWRMSRWGLRGCFFPITIVEHPGCTTGHRKATPAVLRAQGVWLRLRYGRINGLMRLLRDIPRRPAPLIDALRYMLSGYILCPRYFTEEGEDKV